MISRFLLRFSFIYVFVLSNANIFSQLPQTEVWVADFKNIYNKPSLYSLSYLTAFNPQSYNNHPFLFDYNEVYISLSLGSALTTDIYALNIRNKTLRQVTNTPDISEFSPKIFKNSKNFSCVRIEKDGKDQSLWYYPLDRNNKGYRLLSELTNVGYHTWVDDENVALFLVSEPHQLALVNINTEEVEILIDNIGRCLKSDSDGYLYFVHKSSSAHWFLKKYDCKLKVLTSVIKMPFQSEDFDITVNGSFITSKGSKIYIFNPEKDTNWHSFYDFEEFGLQNIQRPSIMRDRIIFVENKG